MAARTRTILLALVATTVPLAFAVVAGWHLLQKPAARSLGDLQVDRSPERVARGEYLVNQVAACFHCHSEVDPDRMGRPPRPGREGHGRVLVSADRGTRLVAGNLTSDAFGGLGAWTDDEILRALREGVGREGQALHPVMPYEAYRSLPDEDARAIVAYLRTLPAAPAPLPATRLPALTRLRISDRPRPLLSAVPPPDPAHPLARGEILAAVARCVSCHASAEDGRAAGASAFMSRLSRATFISRFHSVRRPAGQEPMISPDLNSDMPWTAFAGMSAEDLGAIHDYLRSDLPPSGTWRQP